MKIVIRLLVCSLFAQVVGGFAFSAVAPTEKPKVLIELAKLVDDKLSILVPARIEAKIQSLVSADVEGHAVQILKPLGAAVKAGETVLFLENKDPGFTFAKVPIRSPISGVISQFHIGAMSKVGRGDRLFVVMDPKALKIMAEISSLDSGLLTVGSRGLFNSGKEERQIRVVGLSPLVDPRTGTASAELEFIDERRGPTQVDQSKQGAPAIGTIGQAKFHIKKGAVILLPENSVVYQDGKPAIRVIKADNSTEKRSVELGEQRENLYVVKSGILAGDRVVVRSSRAIREGEAIEIEESKPPAPATTAEKK
jgi:biotin carboxyl carrier protein